MHDTNSPDTLTVVRAQWPTVLESLEHTSWPIAMLLRESLPVAMVWDDAGGIVEVAIPYPYHQHKAEQYRDLIAQHVSATVGQSVRITAVYDPKMKTAA